MLVSGYRDCVQGPAFEALVRARRSPRREGTSGGRGFVLEPADGEDGADGVEDYHGDDSF